MSNKNFETEAIRTQTERSQYQEHSTPIYVSSSFVFVHYSQILRDDRKTGTFFASTFLKPRLALAPALSQVLWCSKLWQPAKNEHKKRQTSVPFLFPVSVTSSPDIGHRNNFLKTGFIFYQACLKRP